MIGWWGGHYHSFAVAIRETQLVLPAEMLPVAQKAKSLWKWSNSYWIMFAQCFKCLGLFFFLFVCFLFRFSLEFPWLSVLMVVYYECIQWIYSSRSFENRFLTYASWLVPEWLNMTKTGVTISLCCWLMFRWSPPRVWSGSLDCQPPCPTIWMWLPSSMSTPILASFSLTAASDRCHSDRPLLASKPPTR